MHLNEKDIQGFKEICEKEGIKYDSEAKYHEAAHNLVEFVDLLMKIDMEEKRRQKRLETEPKGFPVPGEGRTCPLCDNHIFDEDMWYDKYGMKCLTCQDALNKKIVPGYIFKDYKNEKHITASQLAYKYNLHYQTVRKLIRQHDLKIRTIPKSNTIVLLRKENPNLPTILEEEQKKYQKENPV